MPERADDCVVRVATIADEPRLRPWMRAFNAHEGIAMDEVAHAQALRRLLDDPTLGLVFVLELAGEASGYAVLTYNYDLEFAGNDAFLTEIFVVEAARSRGVGRRALEAIEDVARGLDVRSLHIAVRPDNAAALGLYRAAGYEPWTRLLLFKRLS